MKKSTQTKQNKMFSPQSPQSPRHQPSTVLQQCSQLSGEQCSEQYAALSSSQTRPMTPPEVQFRCQVAIAVGSNNENLEQAQRICQMFPTLPTCLAQQSCANFVTGSIDHQTCVNVTRCLENNMPTVQLKK